MSNISTKLKWYIPVSPYFQYDPINRVKDEKKKQDYYINFSEIKKILPLWKMKILTQCYTYCEEWLATIYVLVN